MNRIPEFNMEALAARIAKMNKRAVKLGVEPITITEVGEDFDLLVHVMTDDGRRWVKVARKEGETIPEAQARHAEMIRRSGEPKYTTRRFVLVEVKGTMPRLNGWAMMATIAHDDAGNLLRTVPGVEEPLPVRFRTMTAACDHCEHDRRRKDTYVLLNESGEWKQVGRNCLADFIRSGDAAAWADAAEMMSTLDETVGEYEDDGGEGGGGRGEQYFEIADVLAQVAACIRVDGWCSRGEAKNDYTGTKQATIDQALLFWDSKFVTEMRPEKRALYVPTAADIAKATDGLAWAQALPQDVTKDYLWNLRVVSHRERVTRRESGMAASIITAHARHLEQELALAYERENSLDEYIGVVGKRDTFRLKVVGKRFFQNDFGSTTLYKFRDLEGRTAAWWCSSGEVDLDMRSEYVIKATVKGQELYQGRKQTMLSRAAVLMDLTAFDGCLKGQHTEELNSRGTYCAVCGEVCGEPKHTQDAECDVDPDTNLCRGCGVEHGEPCAVCGGRAFHQDGCAEMDRGAEIGRAA